MMLLFSACNRNVRKFEEAEKNALQDFKNYFEKELGISTDSISKRVFFLFNETQCSSCKESAFAFFSELNISNACFVFSYKLNSRSDLRDYAFKKNWCMVQDSVGAMQKYSTGAEVAPTVIAVENGKFSYFAIYSDAKREQIKHDLEVILKK
jgi:hypothetical protein